MFRGAAPSRKPAFKLRSKHLRVCFYKRSLKGINGRLRLWSHSAICSAPRKFNMDDTAEPFSKLEAGFAEIEVERRPVSVHVEAINRFANASDHLVKDLDFSFNIHDDGARLSAQGMLPALQYNCHAERTNNFASNTEIMCFDHTEAHTTFSTVDDVGLNKILSSIQREDPTDATSCNPGITFSTSPDSTTGTATNERLLIFFVALWPKEGSSFGSQASIQRSCVEKLFKTLDVNPEYLLNLVGRPDYWSPRTRWRRSAKDELIGVGMAHSVIPAVLHLQF